MALNGLGAVRGTGRDSPELDADNESVLGKRDGAEKVIYYIHGGAYYVGNAATHRLVTIGVSKACNARVFGKLPRRPM
jgi:acetyl esterase/lipase